MNRSYLSLRQKRRFVCPAGRIDAAVMRPTGSSGPSLCAEAIADGQRLQATDKVGFQPLRRAGQADLGQPRQQLAEEHPQLQLGKMLAKAKMRPVTKADMPVWLAVDA